MTRGDEIIEIGRVLNTYPKTYMSAGSETSIQSSKSKSSGGGFPATFQVCTPTLFTVPMKVFPRKQNLD